MPLITTFEMHSLHLNSILTIPQHKKFFGVKGESSRVAAKKLKYE